MTSATDNQTVAAAFISFLRKQKFTEEHSEGIEIAMQCISEAFQLDDSLINSIGNLDLSALIKGNGNGNQSEREPSKSIDFAEAERQKTLGNEFIAANKPEKAVECYDKAISLDSSNAIYFSNRAAAYSMMSEHFKALDDAKMACKLNPNYSKAFNRLGKAQMALGEPEDAVISFQKALDLEPTDAGIKASLQAALRASSNDSEVVASESRDAPLWNDPSTGGFDLGSIMNNTQFMAMAQQMTQGGALKDLLKDPNTNIMLESFMKNPELVKAFTNNRRPQ